MEALVGKRYAGHSSEQAVNSSPQPRKDRGNSKTVAVLRCFALDALDNNRPELRDVTVKLHTGGGKTGRNTRASIEAEGAS
jgi:superfamily II DNA or RNA helicase